MLTVFEEQELRTWRISFAEALCISRVAPPPSNSYIVVIVKIYTVQALQFTLLQTLTGWESVSNVEGALLQ